MRLAAIIVLCAAALFVALPPHAMEPSPAAPDQVVTRGLPLHLEELTWTEVQALMARGYRTVIVPTGGVEQNGPHMVLGKHNYIVRHTAGRIARALGNALVAPVVAYVPEGDIAKRAGHMAFPGTISVPAPVFAATLEAAARSFRAHGFTTILLLGDSYGNQPSQHSVAERLNVEWKRAGVRVINVADYYSPANGQAAWLREIGESDAAIGGHAGIRDTSELLAVHPQGVRTDRMRPHWAPGMARSGVNGDPSPASTERGRILLQLKVDAALRQIRAALGAGH